MNMTLRMAIDLYNDLKKIALEEEKSINGEICYILKKYIEEYKIVNDFRKKEVPKFMAKYDFIGDDYLKDFIID